MEKYYEGKREGYCPKCGEVIKDRCGPLVDGIEVIYYFTCSCGLHGSEYYRFEYDFTCGDDDTEDELDTGWDISMSA